MMRPIALGSLALSIALAAGAGAADRLTLDDGSVLEGEYLGGSRSTLHFRAAGEVHHLPLEEVDALAFDPVRQPLAAAGPARTERALIVPVGEGLDALEIRPVPEGETARLAD